MNRYQREVAEMDRRHALAVRATTFLGSAILILAALWGAGFPPSTWWQVTPRWWPVMDESTTTDSATAAQSASESATSTAAPAALTSNALAGTDSSVAPTPQPLILVSTAPGRNKREGTARIGTSRDNPQTYVAGALLANGAWISEIHGDHVVIERGDQRLQLFLSGNQEAIGPTSSAARDLAMMGGPPAHQRPAVLAEDRLYETVRTMAHYENDVLAGLRVIPGRKAGTFAQLGLRAGDVIVAIDSVPVTEAQAATEMLRTLLDGAALTARVRRDDQLVDVALDGSIMAEVK